MARGKRAVKEEAGEAARRTFGETRSGPGSLLSLSSLVFFPYFWQSWFDASSSCVSRAEESSLPPRAAPEVGKGSVAAVSSCERT